MATYHFTNVTVSSRPNNYLLNGTGEGNGDDAFSISKFACKCTAKPAVTNPKDRSGTPRYTITGTNPSGRQIVMPAICIYNAGDDWKQDIPCEFKIV